MEQLCDAWRSSYENLTDVPRPNPEDHHGQGMTTMPLLCNSLSLFFRRWNQFLNYCSEGGKIKIEHAPTCSIPWKLPWGLHLSPSGFPVSDNKQASAGWNPICLSDHISSHGLCS